MHTTSVSIGAIVVLSCQLLAGNVLVAQDGPSDFERCLSYAKQFEELDKTYALYMTSREKLSQERVDALVRLNETSQAVARILTAKAMQAMVAVEGNLIAVQQHSALSKQLDGLEKSERLFEQPNKIEPAAIASQQFAETRVQLDLMYHQMKVTDRAGQLALERRKSIVDELQSIASEWNALDAKALELFGSYWELADVAAVRSDLELRAGLRRLRPSAAGNIGAQFALAISLMRLEDFDNALPLLDGLARIPASRGVALAARGELYARIAEPARATVDIRQALSIGKKDPRVRMHCAMAHAAAGNLKSAEAEWEAVLKLGAQEIAARRALALINASAPNPSERHKSKAAECARLASQLAGDDDWACNMASALAAYANGNVDEAIEAAERASEFAIGEKSIFCDAIVKQIKQGANASWQF